MATRQGDIPVVGPLIKMIFGTRNQRAEKRYRAHASDILAREPEMRRLTDAQLQAKTEEFRARFRGGAKPIEIMDECFAVAREVMDRAVGIRNALNPKFADQFASDRLPAPMRETWERLRAEAAALPDVPPTGRFIGGADPIPGWRRVEVPPEFYDAAREIYPQSKPPFRSRPFDVQLIGAMVLSQGKIAEMKTGEGKTIVAPLAAYLAALEGYKVHVVTVNDYLVQRDRDWTAPYFHALGLAVGAIHPQHMQHEDEKRQMYACDVVYGTTAEFGFDYLRDNMKRSVEQQVQRVREFAIVDEVDSILIDEARTPLIISGQAHEDSPRYELADRLARHLVEKQKPWAEHDQRVEQVKMRIKGLEGDIRNTRDQAKIPEMQAALKAARAELPRLESERDRFVQYFEVEQDRKQAHLTHKGIEEAQRLADVGSFYVGENMDLPHLLTQSIRAHVVYQRDRDYIVAPMENPRTGRQEPSVVIVDVFTGRPMVGRQWSDGLHQACEAKEGVPIKEETQTVATITIQNFFKMYRRLAGMTGTADTEAQEFHDIYKLDVVAIPTNLPVVRRDFNDVVYLTAKDKWDAITDEIKSFHDIGRPVLVGTTSVEKSEKLSEALTRKHGIKHEVLNAKQHEREAHIIENAGQLGSVMIATNMAGRGTDIKLGRVSRQMLLDHWLRRGVAPRELTVDTPDDEARRLIYRKIAPRELGLPKQEAEALNDEEVELRLLRHWVGKHTWVQPEAAAKMSAEECRKALDENGRFGTHRIGWAETIEELGGLHVIGTERHESRRIDNQLRGRSGRQGDRGSTRFFVALDDDLMKMFAGETTMKILARLGMKEGDAIEHEILTKSVERAQRKVEERNFQIRKNILEYDEVMEHQRRSFYGLRQRVLEGRDVRGLVMEYIGQTCDDACERYLDGDYAAECVAEYARQTLNCYIAPEKLRGLDSNEMHQRVRFIAKQEVRETIETTLGEYMPEGAEEVDWDLKGLAVWAGKEFGVDLKPSEVRGMTRKDVSITLAEAAHRRVDAADLSGIERFLDKAYSAGELSKWARVLFGVEVKPEEIVASPESLAAAPDLLRQRAVEAYQRKEAQYPVDFMMEATSGMMAYSPQAAVTQLVEWANTRFGLGWTPESLMTRMPDQIRQELLDASERTVKGGAMAAMMSEAERCPDLAAIEAFCRDRLRIETPRLIHEAREHERRIDLLKGRVEQHFRGEMARFESFVLLEVLDPTWKDHLYAMDQMRDSIHYRSFSQQDPRIEFKREGSKLFKEMNKTVRDRATEYVFKLSLMPQMQAPPAPPPMPAAPRPAAGPLSLGAMGTIAGPGLDGPS